MQEGSSCNKGAVLLSNPKDCQSFLICGANNKYLKQLCPIGLHFDGENKVCNHPQVVNCKVDQRVVESFEDNSQSQNIGSQSSFSQNELVEILMKDDSKIFSNGFELTLDDSDDHNINSDVNNRKMFRTILDTKTDEEDDDNGHNNQSLDWFTIKPAASVQECAYHCSNDQDCCRFEFWANIRQSWCKLYDECILDLHLPQQNPIDQTNQSFDRQIIGNKTTEAHQTLSKNNNDQTLNENISHLDEEVHHQIPIESNNQHLDENTIQEIDENLIEDNNQPLDNQPALDENFSQEAYETPFESNSNQPTVSQNLI